VAKNWIQTDEKQLFVEYTDGYIEIKTLLVQGKKSMNTIDFLNGFHKLFDFKIVSN